MCRIAGLIDRASADLSLRALAMRDAMAHGGPDDQDLYTDPAHGLALGHRRLSIIDLSSHGRQPMQDESHGLVLVFNGEIYNYQELKAALIQQGFTFFSTSDTEVVLRSYQCWGTGCFTRFKGMFAIALYDKTRQQLVLARDHAGIKPLYYYLDQRCLYFASEVRALRTVADRFEEDPHWRAYFLVYGFLPAGRTTLKGVRMLEKGSFLVIDRATLTGKKETFYQPFYQERITRWEEAREAVRHALEQAVQRHLVADAPLGVFLSGGLDSSLITLIASRHKKDLQAVSLDFEDARYSEGAFQQLMAEKSHVVRHTEWLQQEQFTAALPDILQSMDQPTTDGVNSYFVARFARACGLKAVLSGLGADELFGGYPSFRRASLVARLRRLPSRLAPLAALLPRDRLRKLAFLSGPAGNYLFHRGYFVPREVARLLDMDVREVQSLVDDSAITHPLQGLTYGNQMSLLESDIYMEQQLLRDTDFMSMWHGLEVRVPYLDVDLMDLARQLASHLKFGHPQDKFLLIDSFRGELPPAVWQRKKQGFVFPFTEWMQHSLNDYMQGAQDQRMYRQFQAGTLSWSRFWAYMLTHIFGQLPGRKS